MASTALASTALASTALASTALASTALASTALASTALASTALASTALASTMRWQDQLQEGTKLSERSGTLADDPFGGRHPTSHERLTGLPWDASYHDGPAPWDTGQPQRAIVRLAAEGGFAGAVLDAGCGTGENALHAASLGLPVLGFDTTHQKPAAHQKYGEVLPMESEVSRP